MGREGSAGGGEGGTQTPPPGLLSFNRVTFLAAPGRDGGVGPGGPPWTGRTGDGAGVGVLFGLPARGGAEREALSSMNIWLNN